MPPRDFGEKVLSVLDDPQYGTGFAFGLKGDTGITVLEGEGGLSGASSSPPTARQAQLLALASELRPELHRYCARLMGSVIDGEDVVQDTFTRAFVALDELEEDAPMRAWLYSALPTTARSTFCAAARSARPSPSRRPRGRRSGEPRSCGDDDATGGGRNSGVAVCGASDYAAQCGDPQGRARPVPGRDRRHGSTSRSTR